MSNAVKQRIQEIVSKYGYSAEILSEFAEFVQSQPKPRKKKSAASPRKPKALTLTELQNAVVTAFECADLKALKQHEAFKLAIVGRDLNLRKKDAWLILYREWVGVPEDEQNQEGVTCINGIDVLKNFRPWHVFNLDPQSATSDDINAAFRRLAKQHHPDVGGQREVFERLQKMRDSLLVFRDDTKTKK